MSYPRNSHPPKDDEVGIGAVAVAGALILTALVLFILFIMGTIWGFKAFGRTQARADAHNKATVARITSENEQYVNDLKAKGTEVKVKVAQQEAEIRLAQARGIRAAQDEISQTLTPLYVQHQALETMEKMSANGNTMQVVYIPVGANGVPLVSTVPNDAQVKKPE